MPWRLAKIIMFNLILFQLTYFISFKNSLIRQNTYIIIIIIILSDELYLSHINTIIHSITSSEMCSLI